MRAAVLLNASQKSDSKTSRLPRHGTPTGFRVQDPGPNTWNPKLQEISLKDSVPNIVPELHTLITNEPRVAALCPCPKSGSET